MRQRPRSMPAAKWQNTASTYFAAAHCGYFCIAISMTGSINGGSGKITPFFPKLLSLDIQQRRHLLLGDGIADGVLDGRIVKRFRCGRF